MIDLKHKKNAELVDPFSGSEFALPGEEPKAPASAPPKKRGRREKQLNNKRVVRIEDIEQTLRDQGEDVDPETVISYYVPRRRAKLFGARAAG